MTTIVTGVVVALGSTLLDDDETYDLTNIGTLFAFVLVAGGLGERLGHDDIKMGIPIELMTRTTYMQLYCEFIKALEDRLNVGRKGERIVNGQGADTDVGMCSHDGRGL